MVYGAENRDPQSNVWNLNNTALRATSRLFKTRARAWEPAVVTAWGCQAAEVNCARPWVLKMPPCYLHSSENAFALIFGCCSSLQGRGRGLWALLFGLDSL